MRHDLCGDAAPPRTLPLDCCLAGLLGAVLYVAGDDLFALLWAFALLSNGELPRLDDALGL